ncbi:MAG: precorrin-4 C(11)-methyltransferase [Lachnospiraceae bacterium]|nr:precorrin-4 C(11)-methyltransferase [Lachnospiraceae bacterium]
MKEPKNTGCVHFVGAGPGAVDLITLRGKSYLEEADVIIYAGSLVNPELLSFAKKDARIHNSATMTLEEVLGVMEEACKKGERVVRLHTGDPSIYGAIKEQMDALDQMSIPYDCCPGVSAAFGAASSLCLEYTLPGISQSLVLTRMAGKTKVPPKEEIRLWAKHQSTMAIYLSTSLLEELCEQLVEGGYSKDTPAAIVYKATWPEEEAYVGTIGNLVSLAREHGIKKTALILVGEVISTSHYEKSKLYDATFSTEYRMAKTEDI